MSSQKTAAAADDTAKLLSGADIGQVLSSSGPVVKCVLLQHMRPDGRDIKPHATAEDHQHSRQVLTELIQEIQIDTTPQKNEIATRLGGPFTFVGQFPTEGTVVMARRPLPDNLAQQSVHTLREICRDWNVEGVEKMLEKSELVEALQAAELPVNPHRLQPPLDGIVVRGDLILLRVAETEEELDKDDDNDKDETPTKLHVMSNEEFFLDYTKDEYVAFASRTDVVAPPTPDHEEEEDEEEQNEEEDDDYQPGEDSGDDDELDPEEKSAMLNLILAEVIKRFREENGRGPDSRELLELRSEVAQTLGVEVASFEQVAADDDDDDRNKRHALATTSDEHAAKKVKFSSPAAGEKEGLAKADVSDDDKKMPAKESNGSTPKQQPGKETGQK